MSYTITCKGSDCSALGKLFGTACSVDGTTVTCEYSNCNGPVDYTSKSELSASNSTFSASNSLSINDCADVSFDIHGTDVSSADHSSDTRCSTTSSIFATAGSSKTASNSLSSSSTAVHTISIGHETSAPLTQPMGTAKTTAPPISSSSSPPASSTTTQQSSADSRRGSTRMHVSVTTIIPLLMLIFALCSPTVAALGEYTHDALQHPRLLFEDERAVSLASLHHESLKEERGALGIAFNDASTWYKQITDFLSGTDPKLSDAFDTLKKDLFQYACQVFASDVETDIDRQLLFKQQWKQCVIEGETWVQKLKQAVAESGTSGLSDHYLTVAFNLAASTGVKAGCDFLFAKLLQLELGYDPAEKKCDAWLDSLGLTPPSSSSGGTPTTTTQPPETSQTSSTSGKSSFKLVIEETHSSTDGHYIETGGKDLNGVGFDFGGPDAVFSVDSDTGYLYVAGSPNLIVMAYIVTIGWCVTSSIKDIAPTNVRDKDAASLADLKAGGWAPLICSVKSNKLHCTASSPCDGISGTWNTWLLDSFGLYIATGPASGYPQPDLVTKTQSS